LRELKDRAEISGLTIQLLLRWSTTLESDWRRISLASGPVMLLLKIFSSIAL